MRPRHRDIKKEGGSDWGRGKTQNGSLIVSRGRDGEWETTGGEVRRRGMMKANRGGGEKGRQRMRWRCQASKRGVWFRPAGWNRLCSLVIYVSRVKIHPLISFLCLRVRVCPRRAGLRGLGPGEGEQRQQRRRRRQDLLLLQRASAGAGLWHRAQRGQSGPRLQGNPIRPGGRPGLRRHAPIRTPIGLG